jgi:hypothetical protein
MHPSGTCDDVLISLAVVIGVAIPDAFADDVDLAMYPEKRLVIDVD